MEVKGKIQTSEIQAIQNVLQQTFGSILKDYNSLNLVTKDNVGIEAIKMAEEQLKAHEIDISNFPNHDKLQFYITHYVKDIPTIARLQQYINKNEYPRGEKNQEQLKKGILEARSGLGNTLKHLHESENGIQEILTEWAMLQFIIIHPSRISIATMEQLIQHGYQGTCGTPIMKEMYYLIQQLYQLKQENNNLKNQLELIQQEKHIK